MGKNQKSFAISDTHFCHNKKFIYEARGFSSIEEHDETLIKNWNEDVSWDDTVYHFGDVCFKPETSIDRILPRLNGKKVLIMGNHDMNKKLFQYFDKVVSIFVRGGYEENSEFVLTHVPIHPMQLEGRWKDAINLHGHLHPGNDQTKIQQLGERYFNVNCELHGLRPLTFQQVRDKIREIRRQKCH